jgi:AAA+ ATPase superfamily predicted ATPase
MGLLYGRRRLGKTYLLQRFFSEYQGSPRPHCYYLADQTTAVSQRHEAALQLLDAMPDSGISVEELAVSWNSILRYASQGARRIKQEQGHRFGFVLDEFPYLVDQAPGLPSTLQSWWDRDGVHSPLLVILCGSHLSAMATLGEANQPLYGRFNAGIHQIAPLRYDDIAAFYQDSPHYGVSETLMMYGVLGGAPRYHALIDTRQSMRDEIVDTLLRPQSTLENEVHFLLGSQQIRDPAPYNSVLGAVAGGATQFGQLLNETGIERGSLPHILRTLITLGWMTREFPFGETSERRALYRIADPFLSFWYRYIAPLASALQFAAPQQIYDDRIAPYLSDYMGWHVFEEICMQWLRRHAYDRLGLLIQDAARYWSRDSQLEINIMARTDKGYLYGECKWSGGRPVGMDVYNTLQRKVASLPREDQRTGAYFVLFSTGGFTPDLHIVAANPANHLFLTGPDQLLPDAS